MTLHYAIVGHFARDILPQGGHRCGGAVYYSGIQAARLGAEVTVISSAGPELEVTALEPGITIHLTPAPQSTTFENLYNSAGVRTQHCYGQAAPLTPDTAPMLNPLPDLLHLGPLIGEIAPDYARAYPDARLCVAPQGWLRQVDPDGLVRPRIWEPLESVLKSAWAVVFSDEDVGYDEARIETMGRMAPVVVCTRNLHPATLFVEGRRQEVPAFRAKVVDPTGAGDVFAAAFFVRLVESGDPVAAARFAHAAAALSVGGIAAQTIADRARIEAILRGDGLADEGADRV